MTKQPEATAVNEPDIEYIQPSARYSKATIWRGIGYLSAIYPLIEGQNIEEQTREILTTLQACLDTLCAKRSAILKATIFVRNLEDFNAVNRIWDSWVVPGRAPARTPVFGPLL